MYDIVIGRDEADKKKFGSKGVILLGKHYVQMGRTTSLSNPVYLDVTRSHVVFICGKRGSGKSYTMGVIAEGVADLPDEVKQNISIVMLDTMGVYWTMKYPNKKDELLLKQWGMRPKALDVKIYTPAGFHNKFLKQGIPTDAPFSIKPNELDSTDWSLTFGVSKTDPIGVLIERIINTLKKEKPEYSIEDIIKKVRSDDRSEQAVRDAVENRFLNTESWGLFDEKGTSLHDLAKGGQVTILDVSCYATASNGWEIKNLVIGLISQKLFIPKSILIWSLSFNPVISTTIG